jgi:AmiR/NasT family two-component response regulator
LTGDFNLTDIEWDKEENTNKASPNCSKEVNETIINLVNEHNLQQCSNIQLEGTTFLT